jgi:hypothetical protein
MKTEASEKPSAATISDEMRFNPWEFDYKISLPFRGLKEGWRSLGNALWLLIALSDLVTREYSYQGIRAGVVLGGAKLTDKKLADRLGNVFPDRTVKSWRQKLIRIGALAQQRVTWGYQLAVIGTRKFRREPRADIPPWIAAAVDELAARVPASSRDLPVDVGAPGCPGSDAATSEYISTPPRQNIIDPREDSEQDLRAKRPRLLESLRSVVGLTDEEADAVIQGLEEMSAAPGAQSEEVTDEDIPF